VERDLGDRGLDLTRRVIRTMLEIGKPCQTWVGERRHHESASRSNDAVRDGDALNRAQGLPDTRVGQRLDLQDGLEVLRRGDRLEDVESR
jgi:hypothetical protein